MHRQQRFKSGEWTQSTGITRPKFDPTSLAGRGPTRGASQGTSSGEPVTLGPRRKGPRQNVTRLGSTDSNQGSNSSRGATPTSSNMFDLLTENDDMDAQQMTKSSSFNGGHLKVSLVYFDPLWSNFEFYSSFGLSTSTFKIEKYKMQLKMIKLAILKVSFTN